MEEKEIRQLFKNNFDCYADIDKVVIAMTEDRFLEVIKQALHKSCVSDQLSAYKRIVKRSIGSEIYKEIEEEFNADNVKRLYAGGDLKVECSNLVQKPIRITGVHFRTNAPLAQNRCYLPFFLGWFVKKLVHN